MYANTLGCDACVERAKASLVLLRILAEQMAREAQMERLDRAIPGLADLIRKAELRCAARLNVELSAYTLPDTWPQLCRPSEQ